jgi:hypothetical protein
MYPEDYDEYWEGQDDESWANNDEVQEDEEEEPEFLTEGLPEFNGAF